VVANASGIITYRIRILFTSPTYSDAAHIVMGYYPDTRIQLGNSYEITMGGQNSGQTVSGQWIACSANNGTLGTADKWYDLIMTVDASVSTNVQVHFWIDDVYYPNKTYTGAFNDGIRTTTLGKFQVGKDSHDPWHVHGVVSEVLVEHGYILTPP
jgi:hypothetical protein